MFEKNAIVGLSRINTITNRYNRIKVVMLNIPRYLTGSLLGNYSEFPNSSFRQQFSACIDSTQMLVNGGHRNLKQLCNKFLREPYRSLVEAHLDAALT